MIIRFSPLALCLLLIQPALAERADRDKPMQLEANRVTIDDAKKIQILEGDVLITKGTMVLKSDRVVITEDQYGFQKGIAFGGKDGLARIRQKREGKDEFIDGEAERIEYDLDAAHFHFCAFRSGAEHDLERLRRLFKQRLGRNPWRRAVLQTICVQQLYHQLYDLKRARL